MTGHNKRTRGVPAVDIQRTRATVLAIQTFVNAGQAVYATDCYGHERRVMEVPSCDVVADATGAWFAPCGFRSEEEDAVAEARAQMEEAGASRPDAIDWMRDGDTRHFYDD